MSDNPLMKFMINLFAPVQVKKPVPTLPTECMYQVFQHLVDQGEALHPFLLINRYWCRNVIPFLWARPFDNFTLENPENMYKIMSVYLSSLNDAEKADLKDLLIKNSYDTDFISELLNQKKTLFNYPMMLQELSIVKLEMAVQSWIHRCAIEFELSPLLEITPALGFIGLSNITKLEIDYSQQPMLKNTINLMKTIPKLCRRIQTLNIKLPMFESNPDVVEAIVSIITTQNRLKEFSLEGVENENDSQVIIHALQSQVSSLTSVEIDRVNITTLSLYALAKCTNLENLKISNCRKLTVQDMTNTVTTTPSTVDELWNLIKFENLKKLHITKLQRNAIIYSLIIQAAGKSSLRELTMDIITQDTINSMIENCSNLTHLTLIDYCPSLHDHLLSSLFQTLQNVTHLTIQTPSKSHPILASESTIISGKSLPSSLTYLRLQCGFKLDALLSDCQAKLKVLIVDVVKTLYMDMKVITSFIKGQSGSSVKYLGVGIGGETRWNGKVVKELEELKENFGVCVIPSYEFEKW
ncbi:34813_t:CDS:2 [Racocetra persica]|uniref:34813_t:CDS:1 n=1 Tax=Racocetra persica TaxID=160502 RepID=A0ACA9QXM9_9GLOM|nr:34813_t:CDS:2 [Racocetra persica]